MAEGTTTGTKTTRAKSAGSATDKSAKGRSPTGVAAPPMTGFDWNRIIRIPEMGQKHALLDIPVKVREIDEVAVRSIDATVAEMEQDYHVDTDQLVDEIHERGLTAEIAEVTKRLNRTAMSSTRRFVLSRTYAWSLRDVLKAGGDPEDLTGFVSRILHHQESEGPQRLFASHVVRDVAAAQRLDLSEEGLFDLLVLRVHAKF